MLMESVRVTKQARDQLVTVKRHTGIEHWNVVCRWALCISLAEPSRPREQKLVTDSSVEMTWRTFAGEHERLYEALVRERCKQDGIDLTDSAVAHEFKLHLHRGISYLAGDRQIPKTGIAGLIRQAIPSRDLYAR